MNGHLSNDGDQLTKLNIITMKFLIASVANQLDTISEKSSIKDIKDDNAEVEEEIKEHIHETIDLKMWMNLQSDYELITSVRK